MAGRPLIYYVEDDEHIRDLAAYALGQAGMDVRGLPDGSGLASLCRAEPPDAVLLDIMLPGDDGLTLLRRLRADEACADVPVMMLTAKGSEYDAVRGLDAGADDYLAKPFGMMELIARVNALLRRAARPAATGSRGGGEESEVLESGGVRLSPAAHRVVAGGTAVDLTVKEFDLLRALMAREGRVLTRAQLLEEVWGVLYPGETRTVDAHVKTLRQKLAAACPGAERTVETVRGVGYRFQGGES